MKTVLAFIVFGMVLGCIDQLNVEQDGYNQQAGIMLAHGAH